jgi:hypothetical protein
MTDLTEKARQWISDGKDPRSAHWQIGLESIFDSIAGYLEPGRLTPVPTLDKDDQATFMSALEAADLSPNLQAAFLTPTIADKITPPDVLPELQRVTPEQPSYKLLIVRPVFRPTPKTDEDQRILCVEISETAHNPGAEIFQSGELLGTYDFDNQTDCLAALPQIIRAHIWEKGSWSDKDYRQYTLNWFEKVLLLEKGSATVNTETSFFHNPSLIKSDRIEAMFTLIGDMLLKQARDPQEHLSEAVNAIRSINDQKIRNARFTALAEAGVIDMLSKIKQYGLTPFDEFSAKENEQFKTETAKTIRFIADHLT